MENNLDQIDSEFSSDNSTGMVEVELRVGEEEPVALVRPARKRRTPEEEALLKQAREAKRAETEQRRLAREAEKAARPPRHSVKLAKAAAALPQLSGTAQQLFDDLITNLDANEILAVGAHLVHRVRADKTAASRELPKLNQGTEVLITGTNSDNISFLGATGKIIKSQSIHVLVDVDGQEVYLFRCDVKEAAQAVSVSNG